MLLLLKVLNKLKQEIFIAIIAPACPSQVSFAEL